MTTDYRDLITRMAKELDDYRQLLLDDRTVTHRLSNEARAVLARWGNPAPAPPADGEVAEFVEWLQEEADDYECIGCEDSAAKCERVAELLERLASPACVVLKPSPELIEAFQDALPGRIEPLLKERHPAPVPVGERLPQPEVGE